MKNAIMLCLFFAVSVSPVIAVTGGSSDENSFIGMVSFEELLGKYVYFYGDQFYGGKVLDVIGSFVLLEHNYKNRYTNIGLDHSFVLFNNSSEYEKQVAQDKTRGWYF
jgi:hypothetical protein